MNTNKKRIHLHIGTPKTGTTSIQEYLSTNYSRLYHDGHLVPKTSRNCVANHTLLTNYCINKQNITSISIRNGIFTKDALKQFRKNFYQNLREEINSFQGETVIISNEQCYGRLSEVSELEKLKDLFNGLAEQITIIVYIREQSDMLCSFYSSQMKSGKTFKIENLESFQKNGLFDYHNKLKIWEEVFGIENIILRIFNKKNLVENDIVVDFCNTLGLPIYENRPEHLNTALNAKQCEYLRIANQYIPFFHNNRVNPFHRILVESIKHTHIQSPSVVSLINSDYQSAFDESNHLLAIKYFGNSEPLFEKKTLTKTAINQNNILSEQDIADITQQIFNNASIQNELLSKCVAAIFQQKYRDEFVSIDLVHTLFPKDSSKDKINRSEILLKKVGNKIKRIARMLHEN